MEVARSLSSLEQSLGNWAKSGKHTRLPCLPPSLACLHTFPASGSFPMSRLFPSSSQHIGASASVLPMNIQGWFPLGLTGLISLLFRGLSRVFSSTTVQKNQFFGADLSLRSNFSHAYMTTGKIIALTIWTFVSNVMSLRFNTVYGKPMS